MTDNTPHAHIDLAKGITLTDAKAGCACGGHGAGHAHDGAAANAADSAGGCACGGHGAAAATAGCACGGAGHGHHHGGNHHASHHAGHEAHPETVTTVGVTGMTCEHCVASVTEEVSAYEGVTGVSVELVPGGVSLVTVASREPIAHANLEAAVHDAGYQLA